MWNKTGKAGIVSAKRKRNRGKTMAQAKIVVLDNKKWTEFLHKIGLRST